MKKDWQLRGVWFNLDGDYARTVFPDGAICEAIRKDGEGLDWWVHDALHTILAQRMGKPWSPTLYDVATEADMTLHRTDAHHCEEDIVLSFQEFINDGKRPIDYPLARLAEHLPLSMTLKALRAEVIGILNGGRETAPQRGKT